MRKVSATLSPWSLIAIIRDFCHRQMKEERKNAGEKFNNSFYHETIR